LPWPLLRHPRSHRGWRQAEIVLEAAQLQLKHGVTTVRDSYGVLPALVETRERIASPAFARMRG